MATTLTATAQATDCERPLIYAYTEAFEGETNVITVRKEADGRLLVATLQRQLELNLNVDDDRRQKLNLERVIETLDEALKRFFYFGVTQARLYLRGADGRTDCLANISKRESGEFQFDITMPDDHIAIHLMASIHQIADIQFTFDRSTSRGFITTTQANLAQLIFLTRALELIRAEFPKRSFPKASYRTPPDVLKRRAEALGVRKVKIARGIKP